LPAPEPPELGQTHHEILINRGAAKAAWGSL
jgi:hypothetical protein